MEKVDRLGWAAGISFLFYGTRFGIRVNDPAVLPQVEALLPLGWEPNPEGEVDFLYSLLVGGEDRLKGIRRYHLVYGSATRLARTMNLDDALNRLQTSLQTISALLAKDRLFVHAGVVGWQGQAIVIPGRTFSGKTTLVKALVEAGATYYSDEFAIFDAEGNVYPYPIPLSLRDETGRNARKVAPELLGGETGQHPLPIGLVVSTEYHAGAAWQPAKLTPAHTMLALMDNTLAARRHPEKTMPVLKQVAIRAIAIKSARGEAQETAPILLNYINETHTGGINGTSKKS